MWDAVTVKSVDLTSRQGFLESLPKGLVCAELGVNYGRFSAMILDLSSPKELHLVDSWRVYPHCKRIQETWDEARYAVWRRFIDVPEVTIHTKTTHEAAECFEENHFDWIYIDADHTEEGVTSDLKDYAKLVKPNGLILLDDYIDKPHRDGYPRGVIAAVESFLGRAPGYQMVGMTDEVGCPKCLLWRRE